MTTGRFLLAGNTGCLTAALTLTYWTPWLLIIAAMSAFTIYALINDGAHR